MSAAKPAMQSERRTRLRNRPQLLLGMTVTWNAIEAGVAVTAGFAAGSVALVGFGLDSIVEVFAATVAIWQLHGAREDRERKALRLIGLSFFAVAAYVFAESLRDLLVRSRAAESTVGIALAAASLAVMPTLALTKRRLAERLGSATLRAEAAETLLCSWLSAALLVGLVANAMVGWWWADTAAALFIAGLAVREGVEAWHGEAYCVAGEQTAAGT